MAIRMFSPITSSRAERGINQGAAMSTPHAVRVAKNLAAPWLMPRCARHKLSVQIVDGEGESDGRRGGAKAGVEVVVAAALRDLAAAAVRVDAEADAGV